MTIPANTFLIQHGQNPDRQAGPIQHHFTGLTPSITAGQRATLHITAGQSPGGVENPYDIDPLATQSVRRLRRHIAGYFTKTGRKPPFLIRHAKASKREQTWTTTANVRSAAPRWSRRGMPVAARGGGVRLVANDLVRRRCAVST